MPGLSVDTSHKNLYEGPPLHKILYERPPVISSSYHLKLVHKGKKHTIPLQEDFQKGQYRQLQIPSFP